MTRRSLKRVGLSSLAAALVLSTLAACGGGTDTSAKDDSTSTQAADPSQFDRDATIKIGTPSPSSILDPALQNNIGQNTFTFLIYDSLTQFNANYELEPMLAKSWEFSKDGGSLTLQLRDDVVFNDGTAFDASVVKANIERGQTMPGSALVAALNPISKVVVEDADTVRLDLKPGLGAELPSVFALNAGMMVSPKAIADRSDELALDPADAGSGPYIPTKVTPGQEVVFERSDKYWNDDTAYAKSLVVRTVPDHAARINGVRTGDLDVAQISAAASVQESLALIKQGQLFGDKINQATPSMLMFNAERGDLAKPEIRKAIALAVDRKSIVQGLFAGNATEANQFYADGFWAHDPNFAAGLDFDLDAAKKLVSEAGGASITLAAATGSSAEPIAQALQAQLEDAGIKVELKSIPFEQIDDSFRRGELDAQVISASPAPDPAGTMAYYVTDGFKADRGHGEVLTGLAAAAADPKLSQDDRATKYREIWKLMAEKVMWVPVIWGQQVWIRNDKIANVANLPWVRSGFPSYRDIAKLK